MSKNDLEIKMCSNTISLGKGKTFDEIINKVASQNGMMTKQASKEEKDEAESSGQPEAEGKLVNDPKVLDEKKDCSAKGEEDMTKEAGEKSSDSNDSDDKGDDDKEDKKDDDKEEKEASTKDDEEKKDDKEKKEASGKNEDECADSSGQLDCEPLHQKGESENAGNETKKEKKTEAGQESKFVKVAKLNSKTRAFLQDYYSSYYPPEFVEALLAEK